MYCREAECAVRKSLAGKGLGEDRKWSYPQRRALSPCFCRRLADVLVFPTTRASVRGLIDDTRSADNHRWQASNRDGVRALGREGPAACLLAPAHAAPPLSASPAGGAQYPRRVVDRAVVFLSASRRRRLRSGLSAIRNASRTRGGTPRPACSRPTRRHSPVLIPGLQRIRLVAQFRPVNGKTCDTPCCVGVPVVGSWLSRGYAPTAALA